MYRTYNARPIPRPSQTPRVRKYKWALGFLMLLILLALYTAYALLRPLPGIKTIILPPVATAEVSVALPWPVAGQAAFGADGYGVLASSGTQEPAPIASVTKAITAMAVLDKKPLRAGETGPLITFSARDVALYNEYVAKDGSAVPVAEGEQISQYQAIQAMMLPSANNIADTTALWAFGSMEAYTAYANALVKQLGMSQTTVTDASGFSPDTISTPRDLIKLGDAVLDHPVLSEIVAQKEAVFPGYGTIRNVNTFLGQSGIRGIKTGNTEEAGGCYLAAADIMVGGRKITVITVIMGSTSRPQAMRDSVPLIQSAASYFKQVEIVRDGEVVGRATTPWGAQSDLVADTGMSVLAWQGTALAPRAKKEKLSTSAPSGTLAGFLELTYQGETFTTLLRTRETIAPPTVWWRLSHPW